MLFVRAQKCMTLSATEGDSVLLLRTSEGVSVFETSVAFNFVWEGYSVFSGVRGQPRRCATCVEPSDELVYVGDISVTHVSSKYQHVDILPKLRL